MKRGNKKELKETIIVMLVLYLIASGFLILMALNVKQYDKEHSNDSNYYVEYNASIE